MNGAIKEIEELFNTKAKGNVIYYNDINYTPIPLPVVNAVKAIMEEYPDLGCQIGLYSVKILDKNYRLIKNSMSKKKEVDSSRVGDIHDDYVMNKINEDETISTLKEHGYNTRKAKELVKRWEPNVIKSSLSDYFPVSTEEGWELDELEETFGKDKSELRSVLEDYFHLYDDYSSMSVQEFDQHLADYFQSKEEITSAFFQEGQECVIEINKDGRWEFVSLDNTPEGWSTNKSAKVFPSSKDAKSSALMKRLNQAGYSEAEGNLKISEY